MLRVALDVSDAIAGADCSWPDVLVSGLAESMGADTVGYADGLESGFLGHSTNVGGPPLSASQRQMWTTHWIEYPFFVDLMAGGSGHAQRASDRIPDLAAFRRTTIYAEHFRPRRARYHANVALVSAGSTALVGLYRTGHDFTDVEIQALEVARQLLVQTLAYRAAVSQTNRLLQAHSSVVERRILTPRQEDVLALVSTGATDYAIGRRLGISERTVRKHLEDIRQRLKVTNRVAAATWWLSARSRNNARV